MNQQKLIEILGIQTVSGNDVEMREFLEKELQEIGCEFNYNEEDGNIYVTKGQANHFPCIVAHMDTVHKIVEDLYVLRVGPKLTGFNRVRMEQTGIGGDDKVGIFIALECLRTFDNIKAVFFCDEEIGCFGSYDADMSFFDDVGMVLQCDRQGNKDFVHIAGGTPLSSKQFRKQARKIMMDYKYDFKEGMMTDVMALKESGLKCSCANMSCGYYNPHRAKEYVDMDDVENCLDMVLEMFTVMGGLNWAHEYKKPQVTYYKDWGNAAKKLSTLEEMNLKTLKLLGETKKNGRLSRSDLDWDNMGDGNWDGYSYGGYGKKDEEEIQYCDCCGEKSSEIKHISYYNQDICQVCIDQYEIYQEKDIV